MILEQTLVNFRLVYIITNCHFIECIVYSLLPNDTIKCEFEYSIRKEQVSDVNEYIKSLFPTNANFIKFATESVTYTSLTGADSITHKYIVTY